MKQRIVVINVLLLAMAAWCGWLLRQNWLEARQREREVLARRASALPAAGYQAAALATPAQPAGYADVALRTLFSRDRNPNVVLDPPPPPPPPTPVPAFPKAYGVMDLGSGPLVFLGQGGGKQRPYRQGEVLGPWKIVKIADEKITLEWTDEKKTFEKTLDELRDRGGASSGEAAASNAGAPPPDAVITQTIAVAKPEGPVNAPGQTSGQVKLCNPGDTNPAGAVVDGYRKVVIRTPFGEVCRWDPVQ